MARVLVVGGAGYVGGFLTDRLVAAGHAVRVYDRLLYEDVYLKPVDFVYGDVRHEATLDPLLAWADAVVWLAALVGDGACSLDPSLTVEINVESVRRLARKFDRRIVFMSTCSVYGAADGLLTEESPVSPLSLYAETKLEAEGVLAASDAVSFRLGTLYGLGDSYSRIRMDLVANALTVKALLHGRMSVFGGAQYRPLLHVRDVAEAVLAALSGGSRGIYNLHAANMQIHELAEAISREVPEARVHHTEIRFQDARNYRVSSDKAARDLGFAPRLRLEDGIREIKALVQQGRIRDLSSPRFSNTDFLRPRLVPERTPLGFEVGANDKLGR
jgi:nucleoside-diphosphate-sugar epimerase